MTTPTTDSIVLRGRYRLGQVLGTGGMATVHEGRDLVLDRPVAVKLLAPALATDPSFVARFRQEALATAQLSHPNIVTVYDAGTDRHSPYLVMELVRGRTLAHLIRTDGPLAPAEAARIGADIADALAAAHAKGIVHRDVKPANVLLAPGGRVKVTDFGIARTLGSGSLTRVGMVLGTPSYLAPEQARGEPADARSDLYALGCVLYEMLTGAPPHVGDSAMVVAAQHLHANPPPPSALAPGVSPPMDESVMRALAKDPRDRFASATEMAGSLRRSAASTSGGGGPALPAGPTDVIERVSTAELEPAPRRPRRRRGRRRGDTIVAVAMACAAVLAVVLFSTLGSHPRGLSARTSPTSAAPPSSPSPTSRPTNANSPPPVAQAYQAYVSAVLSGKESRQISPPAANDLMHRGGDLMAAYGAGHLSDALAMIAQLDQELGGLEATGRISSESAKAVHRALTVLGRAMQASPSPPSQPPGPGDGNGQGNADGG